MSKENQDLGDVAGALSVYLKDYRDSGVHISRGLSQHGTCKGEQMLKMAFGDDFDGQGATAAGQAGHDMHQSMIPSGTVLNNVNGKPTWLIVGHEQYIRHDDGTDRGRLSPIDTLVYNFVSKEFEVWDLKFTKIQIKYVYDPPRQYKMQLNLYGQQLKDQWHLPYNPTCRLIYTNKDNYLDKKEFAWKATTYMLDMSKKLIKEVMDFEQKLKESESGAISIEMTEWASCAEGINLFNMNKVPKRYMCEHCNFTELCLFMLGKHDAWLSDKWIEDQKLFNVEK